MTQYFYAITIPKHVREQIERVQDRLDVSWTKKKNPNKFHITLRHLNDNHWDPAKCSPRTIVPRKALMGAEGISQFGIGPLRVSFAGVGEFDRPQDSVLWLGFGQQTQLALQTLGFRLGAPKSFKPHLTLGYADEYQYNPQVTHEVDSFDVTEIHLLGTTDGDEYETIRTFPL